MNEIIFVADKNGGYTCFYKDIPTIIAEGYTMFEAEANLIALKKAADFHEAQEKINLVTENKGKLSDGYHTFNELYEHRYLLFMALCKTYSDNTLNKPWISKCHSDGSCYDGYFILGIFDNPIYQITYHLPMKYYHECTSFAKQLPLAHKFDGHTSKDVINRLYDIITI